MNKTITMRLNSESIDDVIKQLDEYAQRLNVKAQELASLVAERIAWSASQGFSTAIADDIFTTGDRPSPDVSVSVEDNGNIQLVIASGSDAVFVEFGAGVYYNGAAGTSPHPDGAENGFLIGEYGKGKGKKNVWALPGSTKLNPILTHGTPAAMPMYHGVEEALRVIVDLAQEVFAS